MSSITSLKISGFRSYNPDSQQTIHFMKPLTLIWGKNGSGKTTIIECLKFITTGTLPPFSNLGKSFVMDSKVAVRPQVMGQITLNLVSAINQLPVTANKKVILSNTNKGTKFQSKQQSITIIDLQGKKVTINHHCAQIEKQIPMILGISKPILQNIVFCHQEESLWPFSQNNHLKSIFDQLFETNSFSKYMEHLWQIYKDENKRLKQLKVRLQYEKQINLKDVQNRLQCLSQLQNLQKQSETVGILKLKLDNLKNKITQNLQTVKQREAILLKIGNYQSQLHNIRDQIKRSKQSYYDIQNNPTKKLSKLSQIGYQKHYYNPQKKEVMEIQLPRVNIQESKVILEQKQKLIQQLKNKKQELEETINQQKNKTEFNKKQLQIDMELKRVLQIYPNLKGINEDQILQNLKNKIKYMESVISSLQVFKREKQAAQLQLAKITIAEPFCSKEEYQINKNKLMQVSNQVNKMHIHVIFVYKSMFVPTRKIVYTGPPDLQKQKINIQAVIKSKQEQVIKYQRTQKRQTKEEVIQHLQYTGIVAQQRNIYSCQETKRCNVCNRPLNQPQMKEVEMKATKIIEKAQQKIKQLRQDQTKEQAYVDPDQMVRKLKQQIKELLQKKRILESHNRFLQEYSQNQKQKKLNEALDIQYNKCNIPKDEFHRVKVSTIDTNLMRIEQYKQLISSYLLNVTILNNLREKVNKYEQIKQKNQKNKKVLQQNTNKKQQLKQSMEKIKSEIRYYQMTISMHNKLSQLLKVKKGKSTNKNKKQNNAQTFKRVQDAEAEFANVCKMINTQELAARQLAVLIKYTYFSQDEEIKQKQLNQQLALKLQRMDKKLQNSRDKVDQYNRLNIQYTGQKKRLQMSIKDIQFKIQREPQNLYNTYKIRQKAIQKSLKDIQSLCKIIQLSINNYHEQKMIQINNILKEVWRQVYDGHDIQYIQIQATPDSQSSKRKKINLNYSIFMKKKVHLPSKNSNIQMKGRCSMGQKVLASIVIRLALAQSFSINSRILALDEPTTNLDRVHIRNLANQLGRLIELSQQRNLQLIIISHDIEFIQTLEEYSSQYYEVFRDQNNFSVVRRRDMKELVGMHKEHGRVQIQNY